MARKFASEDYRESKNLTPEQKEFDRLWTEMASIQKGKKDMPYAAIGFKPAVRRRHQMDRGQVTPFREDRLVVREDEVTVVMLSRIPTRHWRGARQNRTFRLNLAEVPFYTFPGDGELHAAASELPEDLQRRVYQVDLSMNPRQDGQVFEERHWSDDQLIPQSPDLAAAHGGQFQLKRDDLYMDLTVNDVVYYRIPLEFAENITVAVTNMSVVENGALLATCTGPVTYGVAVLDDCGKPKVDRVGSPVISATRKVHTLRMGLAMLRRMLRSPSGPKEERELLSVPMETWAPQQLVNLSLTEFGQLRDMPGWSETIDMKTDLRKALGPKGDFWVVSPVEEELTFLHCEDPVGGVKDLVFLDQDGDEIAIEIPACGEVLESVANGAKVNQGDPLATFVPRKHYASWEDLQEALGDSWPFVVDCFLQHMSIWPGQLKRDDYQVLVPAKYISGVLSEAQVQKVSWVDLRSCKDYLNKEDGTIIPPAFSHPDWADMLMSVNGIGYDMTPVCSRITGSPIQERRRQDVAVHA